MKHTLKLSLVLAAVALTAQTQAIAQDKVLNLYSARHYQTDEAMYDTFTRTTGIKINRVDADDAGIIARLRAEGAASPADVIMLVDAARLAVADMQGLFQPIKSAKLDETIPSNLRATATADGVTWTGFSTRARVVVYDQARVKAEDVATYEQLADPKLKGMVWHALWLAPLQPVAVRHRGRAPGRPEGRSLAQGTGGQHGARTQGW